MSRGWWTVWRIGTARVRLHWTVPVGAFVMGRFAFVPAFWLGFVVLVLVHELGHALLVIRYRLGLSEIAIHGLGGYCRHERSGTRFEEAAVAWGGVLAQVALLLAAYAVVLLSGPPKSVHAALLLQVFTTSNLWLILLNLLPIEPLDGKKAWPLLGMLRERFSPQTQERARARQQRPPVQDEQDRGQAEGAQETPSARTDRLVRELVARTTQPKKPN